MWINFCFNQIFFNLLSNAVKFTPEGGKIEVSWEMINEYGKMAVLKFTVKDNGIGMSKEFQKTMFDSFTPGTPAYHRTGGYGTRAFYCEKSCETDGWKD